MKASLLIADLALKIEEHGDLEVVIDDRGIYVTVDGFHEPQELEYQDDSMGTVTKPAFELDF